MYDLIIKNGTVIDPSQDIEDQRDIAISEGKIAAIEVHIPSQAKKIIDATQRYVTPGLIDLHTHVYWGGTPLGINADQHCLANGVTTVLDAGSAGWRNFLGFKTHIIASSRTRIIPLLHISSIGLIRSLELEDIRHLEYDAAVDLYLQHSDLLKGLKIRFASPPNNHVGQNGPQALRLIREAAEDTGGLIMVHPKSMSPGFPLAEILKLLRQGDIVTHCFSPSYPRYFPHAEILNEAGQVTEPVRQAANRGVIFDIGHGSGSFSFETASKALHDGFLPTTISTDLHTASLQTAHDLPTTLSKFLALGLSLHKVIELGTTNPAAALSLHDCIGTLKPGAEADVTLFALREGTFTFHDVRGTSLVGTQRLLPTHVIKHGVLVKASD
jgi:dihydroorotase